MLFSLHSLEIPEEGERYIYMLFPLFDTCLLAIERAKQRRVPWTFRLLAGVVPLALPWLLGIDQVVSVVVQHPTDDEGSLPWG